MNYPALSNKDTLEGLIRSERALMPRLGGSGFLAPFVKAREPRNAWNYANFHTNYAKFRRLPENKKKF
jgi:hypothetical protein